MKYLFALGALLLAVGGYATWLALPDTRSPVPVVYWVTDNNPARREQIRRFQDWLTRMNGPAMELRLDTSNADQSKKIIQGVSGVAGDIIDTGGYDLPYLQAIGLFDDVTADAKKLGFDPSHTYPAIGPQITLDGKQYLFPCNVWGNLYFVNKATFAKYSQPVPPRRWTFDQFESAGKAFVAAANPPGQRSRVFFCDGVDREVMRRSLGLSLFNETLTRCVLDDPRNVRVLKVVHQWMFTDRLIPTNADRSSFATASGYGGSSAQLFNSGTYAMMANGRHLLIQFRQFNPPIDLGISESPNGGYPNMLVGTRAAGIYAGSKHKDLARSFLAFLASEQYNANIVDDADGLPPNPVFTESNAYRSPSKYPNEREVHQAFTDSVNQTGAPFVISPFVLFSVAGRIEEGQYDAFMSNLCAAEQAAAETQRRINQEIDQTLTEQPALRPHYDELVRRQQQIEDLRRRGEKVPLRLIENPFLRQYYRAMGWASEDKP